jgi:hypothetical protein
VATLDCGIRHERILNQVSQTLEQKKIPTYDCDLPSEMILDLAVLHCIWRLIRDDMVQLWRTVNMYG